MNDMTLEQIQKIVQMYKKEKKKAENNSDI